MTRLNADSVAAFFSLDTPTADCSIPKTEPATEPFGDFLQRAGRSADTGAESDERTGERADDSGPIDTASDPDDRDTSRSTEPDREPEKNSDPADPPSDVGNRASENDEHEAVDSQTDDETDEQVEAANGAGSGENTQNNEQARIGLTETGASDGGQNTGDDADKPTDQNRSRSSEDLHESRRGGAQATKPAAADVQSEQKGQARLESEGSTGEEKPTESREQPQEKKPIGPSAGDQNANSDQDQVVAESANGSKENASGQASNEDALNPTVSGQQERTPAEEPRRQSRKQGSSRTGAQTREASAGERASQTVAKTTAGQDMAAIMERVAADDGTMADEAKAESAEKTVRPTSTADLKAASAAPAKGWSPEGMRSSPAESNQSGSQSEQVDRARFVQRVARAFEAVGDGDGSVRLRLKPPELGGMRLEVSVRNGTMTAHIETETAAARTLLLDNLPALRERLAQQDIKVDSFDVELADRSPDGSPQRPDDDRQPRERTGGDEARTRENQDGDAADTGSAGAVNRSGEGARLDVVI